MQFQKTTPNNTEHVRPWQQIPAFIKEGPRLHAKSNDGKWGFILVFRQYHCFAEM